MVDILEAVRTDCRAKRGRLRQIARESGVSLSTLHRIVRDEKANPTHRNVEKLELWWERRQAA